MPASLGISTIQSIGGVSNSVGPDGDLRIDDVVSHSGINVATSSTSQKMTRNFRASTSSGVTKGSLNKAQLVRQLALQREQELS